MTILPDFFKGEKSDKELIACQGLHVLFWDEAIENLKEKYNENN